MKICSVEGCGIKAHGHGLCRKHYSVEFAWKRKAWDAANPDKVKEYKRRSAKKHSSNNVARATKWNAANPEKRKATVRKWDREHADQVNAKTAKRRATKLNATPKWANAFSIAEAYHLARLRTKMLGFKWHVDHIVPLQSKIVCGLHVENNLQVIPALNNRVKSNMSWPNMPT